MRELHAVLLADDLSNPTIKRHAVLFDKFLAVELHMRGNEDHSESRPITDFLYSQGLAAEAKLKHTLTGGPFVAEAEIPLGEDFVPYFEDGIVRGFAATIVRGPNVDVVPICQRPLPHRLPKTFPPNIGQLETTLRIALNALPLPDDHCSWQDIIDFKANLHDKQWAFRRFLSTLVTKNQTEAEIRDEIEWMLNEYRKAMELHHIKSSQSFVDVFVITPLEIVENLVKFNWSKIAKGALQVKKRKVELLEAEMKAPGRECAYIFDARKRFSR